MVRHLLRRVGVILAAAVATALVGGTPALANAAHPSHVNQGHNRARHVLLISVDGLHSSDLAWYAKQHPRSALAQLLKGGASFPHALAPVPSDSYPGIVGPLTGGNPRSTGIYYDDTWNHSVFPAGTTSCTGPAPGGEVAYMEAADKDSSWLDAGQTPHLEPNPNLTNQNSDRVLTPAQVPILGLTAQARDLMDPRQLPVDARTCRPIWPHQYIKVNTVFEVARQAGLRTAWSDKHPANEILNGPSGTGVQDFFAPEINSNAPNHAGTQDWTQDNSLTMQYDSYKVQAVVNEINGFDHSGTRRVGVPAVFGLNFQTVSTAQKLPSSDGLQGGYRTDGSTPGPLLGRALNFINSKVGLMLKAIRDRGLQSRTTIILTAKHGQSPLVGSALNRIDDGTVVSDLNASWQATHPANPQLVQFSSDDDGMLLWLSDRSPAALQFAKDYLWNYSNGRASVDGKPVTHAGLSQIFAGQSAANYFGVAVGDPRVPDIFGITQYGVVYTGHKKKIAEHGGAHLEDRNVALVVYGAGVGRPRAHRQWVETTQIAPSILELLGINPRALQAVRQEGTRTLNIR